MSARTERSRRSDVTSDLLEYFQRWYHFPALAAIVSFMFWARFQSYDAFMRSDGTPSMAAVDSWYHWRTINYSVQNWPYTMPFDPWTGFPTGRYVGQFGTLFDQLVATLALLIGLGDPDPTRILLAGLIAVPLIGALVAIPLYFIGKLLGGRPGGLAAAALLALFPGSFFYRSMVGQLDHHAAEVLFMTLAILGFMVAIAVAERERPIWELVPDRDVEGLRRPALASVLAGFALGLYLWIWPAGVFLVGVLGIFFVLKLSGDYVRGVSPDHVAFVGAVSMPVTALMTLAKVERMSMGATTFGLLQPTLALGVAAGCVFMAWLAREWDRRELQPTGYPIAVGAAIVLSLLVLRIGLPDVFAMIVDNFYRRMTPLGEHVTDLTISEAQPPDNPSQHFFGEFGLAFYTMLAGLIGMAIQPFFGGRHRGERLLVIVWSIMLLSMAMTQVRFNYYLAVPVAAVNAFVVGWVLRWADVTGPIDSLRSIDGYQVMSLLAVAMLLFLPLMPPVAGTTVIDRGAAAGPSGDSVKWEGSNLWLASNTPPEGDWGGAGNDDELRYYGTYPMPENGDFAYPAGTYGVMSWWDYGHLITVQGERIPHANPFQQNARTASAFLTAQSEERAERLLDALPGGPGPNDSDEELDSIIADLDDQQRNERVRYVMIDDSMAGSKFAAVATWTGEYGEFIETQRYAVGEDENISVPGLASSYDQTMLSRLYFADGSGLEHYRLVHESPEQSTFVSVAVRQEGQPWQPYVINRELTFSLQRELQQLIQHPAVEVELYEQREGARVKTFERVEGATLAGSVDDFDENTTVAAMLTLNATSSNRTVTYFQTATPDENGAFEMTVPYATDNSLGPEDGYTDSSVLAEGEYRVFAAQNPTLVAAGFVDPSAEGATAVPERAIYDGERIEVELEPVTSDDGNESDGSTGDESGENEGGNETETTPEGTEGDGASNDSNTSSLLAPVGLTDR